MIENRVYREIIEILKKYFLDKDYKLVLLFGSFAKGDFHSFSDVDIAVWIEKDEIENKIDLNLELEEILGKKVDIVNLKDLFKKDSLLSYEIAINHIPIKIADEELYIDFKSKSYLYYFDRKPLYKMIDKAFKERIEKDDIAKVTKIRR
ncbi:type VII toxin-antitoxin system MntA family adenylyltransferase antitoxin [Nitrosophilus labii]|uniref:type VII toxin-antitoxin system MntA family adenylyltransferase antitoxin n=1 Tax=Nitrosophilus labii TaxID=2706014 RepID=UPI001656DD42|nr:nucleotidyltransferase domain-containing protein [Nitrosophilus labii]